MRITGENRIAGIGLELTGTVSVAEDKRDYRPQMVLADEGQVRKVTCVRDVPQAGHQGWAVRSPDRAAAGVRGEGIEEGEERRRGEVRDPRSRSEGEVERRSISLERDKIKYRWGLSGQAMRPPRSTTVQRRGRRALAYFAKLADLDAKGYLDAIAE